MSTSPPRNRRWIWFFVILFVLTSAAITIGRISVFRQQLKPEELAAAQTRWKAKGPSDYRLSYTIAKLNSADEKYVVDVRGGKVVFVALDGRPLGPERFHYYGMPMLYEYIQDFLDRDSQSESPRAYFTATFDQEHDGRLVRYVRSVSSTPERLEIKDIQVAPPEE